MKQENTLYDAEMNLMSLVWAQEPIKAKELAALAWGELGWKTTTTYTVLKRLCDRGIIKRAEPEFIITSLISKSDVTKEHVGKIVDKLYSGSRKLFLASFLEEEALTEKELSEIRTLLESYDKSPEVEQ
jgi:predicted transcriptional regulator